MVLVGRIRRIEAWGKNNKYPSIILSKKLHRQRTELLNKYTRWLNKFDSFKSSSVTLLNKNLI